MWTKTITVQKPNAFFFFQCQYIRWSTFPSYDKTTTTVRITIHNKCNKYNKSEMNTEMRKLIFTNSYWKINELVVGFFIFLFAKSYKASEKKTKKTNKIKSVHLLVDRGVVSPLGSSKEGATANWCVAGSRVSSHTDRQQTGTRGNLFQRKKMQETPTRCAIAWLTFRCYRRASSTSVVVEGRSDVNAYAEPDKTTACTWCIYSELQWFTVKYIEQERTVVIRGNQTVHGLRLSSKFREQFVSQGL